MPFFFHFKDFGNSKEFLSRKKVLETRPETLFGFCSLK